MTNSPPIAPDRPHTAANVADHTAITTTQAAAPSPSPQVATCTECGSTDIKRCERTGWNYCANCRSGMVATPSPSPMTHSATGDGWESPAQAFERIQALLSAAQLEEQKNENAFPASGGNLNRKAMAQRARAAWKAFDDALMQALSASPPVAAGWRAVPVEIDESMRRAIGWAISDRGINANDEDLRAIWAAALSAAPAQPVSEQDQGLSVAQELTGGPVCAPREAQPPRSEREDR